VTQKERTDNFEETNAQMFLFYTLKNFVFQSNQM